MSHIDPFKLMHELEFVMSDKAGDLDCPYRQMWRMIYESTVTTSTDEAERLNIKLEEERTRNGV